MAQSKPCHCKSKEWEGNRKNRLKANQIQPGKIPNPATSVCAPKDWGSPVSPALLLLSHTLAQGLAPLHKYCSPWQISWSPAISNTLESPLQLMLHVPSFTWWLPKVSL